MVFRIINIQTIKDTCTYNSSSEKKRVGKQLHEGAFANICNIGEHIYICFPVVYKDLTLVIGAAASSATRVGETIHRRGVESIRPA